MDPLANFEYQKGSEQSPPIMEDTNQLLGGNFDSGNPSHPATPRMLRSVSGNTKATSSDVNQQWPPHNQNSSRTSESEGYTQQSSKGLRRDFLQGSNSRDINYHRPPETQQYQYQQPHPQQHLELSSFHRRIPSGSSVSRTPSVNKKPPSSPAPMGLSPSQPPKKAELLPPAAISSPANEPTPGTANQHLPLRQSQHPLRDSSQHHHQQQFHRKSIGDWTFVKTIGAGSMGKVKLAQHNTTGEICAVKIVPRAAKLYQRAHANDLPPANAQAAAQRQKEFEKEVARDKRTIREGALGRLLFHPFICRLYEMVPMTNHYYMLFEYVEGGQMLDYIVSHGSLKERNARKFARGIASALDYCHKNNVVHRDLKIENIMINQKGDIKIIDFGLSNLYAPKSLLKTYCGSLYFAAPELLSAKPYMGPEVDVWSFGVVLYVLVCGKVPFDDQSVSVLHEKIKKGNVEYPAFLSRECVSLLSRMLIVDPLKRATLYEVINHPWMKKGYDYPVSNFLPNRVPLTLPLDPEIIKAIASFELGSYQSIAEELDNIIGSVEYQMCAENWYKLMEQGREYASASNSHILPDPTGGFHPLISIYYLVDEMRKRKKAKEMSLRAQLEQQNELHEKEKVAVPTQDVDFRSQQAETPSAARQQNLPSLPFPPQAHTSMSPSTFNRSSHSPPTTTDQQQTIPNQQPLSARDTLPIHDTLDPNAGKGGLNSILRRLSSKKYKNQSSPPPKESVTSPPETSEQTIAPPPLPKVSITPDSKERLASQTSFASGKRDPLVRRGVSMKVTAKEKSSASRLNLAESNTQPPQEQETEKKTTHNRSLSSSNPNKLHGFIPVEYLPPLPNINTGSNNTVTIGSPKLLPATGKKMHPTARAKSVGGYVGKESNGGYRHRAQTQNIAHPPLPNKLASQNSDEAITTNQDQSDGFFDDVTLDDVQYQEIPNLTENQIIEQFNSAKPNSMPSIEYPKTLFLKGFFSVQTTSTKPLPVIRYNIINVLSKLGVKFREVKGGFVCVHVPSVQQPTKTLNDHSYDTSIQQNMSAENSEEDRLYGDAFKSSSSLEKEQPTRSKTPETEGPPQTRTPSRQPSLHVNTQNFPMSPSNSTSKTHKPSNSTGSSHRRKFSIGNSLLGSYRKKNGSQVVMPPNTPATAKLTKLLYSEGDDTVYGDDENTKTFDDDSIDSLNGIMIGGGSDMLVSSRLEQKTKHQHATNGQLGKRSPLKFEIHIVKVPLVGLYGVQFKKILGNTWNYKTLASQILNDLNL
ncbi:uncharacterized protein PRCAT00001271001 [Priceomyces carsonii]|uniref:uncharacterized protein n=1 Tax=Priceomyces carsonii TaxID=28549 RepID=UPI002ED98C6E|nr:unnamed protein product [Priceomyces carsonii]